MRFVDYTVLGESTKEPESDKTIRPSSPTVVNSRSVQATGFAAPLGGGQAEPMDLTTFYKTISAQGKLAIKQKAEQGESMHQAPLGYRNVHIRGRTVLEPDPKTYPLVEDARRLRQQGCTVRTICKVMAERGLRSSRGKVIGPSSMHLVLRQPKALRAPLSDYGRKSAAAISLTPSECHRLYEPNRTRTS